jgi:uncharacterized protein (DUF1697 family)
LGFKPRVILLTIGQLNAAVEANPYPQAKREPKALHLFFLADDAINVDSDALNVLKKDSEQFALVDRVFYLYAPEGIGRSKLAARVENLLGVPLTARNWRTVGKVLQLAR